MDSLSNLNSYASTSITYEDGRISQLIYSNATPVNGNVFVNEGSNSAVYLGTDIRRIINPANNVYYWLYMPTEPNITITWPTMPSGVTLTNVSANTYKVGPLQSIGKWDAIKQPVLTFTRDWAPHVFTYESAIQVSNVNNASWSTTVTIVDSPELSDAGDFTYTTNGSEVISQPALIVDTDANATAQYSITLTSWSNLFPIPGTLSSAGSLGGNTSYSGNILTISGNIYQVNEQLANITYTTTSSMYSDFLGVYTLTNPESGLVTTVYQNFYSDSLQYLSRTTAQESYYEDTNVTLANVPHFIDSANGLGTYSMTITAIGQSANATSNFNTNGTGTISKTLAANTQQVVFTGTRANLNSHLGNLTIVPYPDYDKNFLLKFEGNTMLGNLAARTKLMVCAGTNIDAGDLGADRLMYRNTPGLLFPTNPVQITDVPSGTDSYSVTMSSTAGGFRQSANVYAASVTFTGTKANINAQLANVNYYPNKGYTGYTLISYKQTYLPTSNVQANSNINLVVVANISNIPEQTTYTWTPNVGNPSYTFTPTEFQSRYLKCNLTVNANVGYGSVTVDGFILPYDSYTIAFNKQETSGTRRYNTIYPNNLLGGYGTGTYSTHNVVPNAPIYTPYTSNKGKIGYLMIDKQYYTHPQPTVPTLSTKQPFYFLAGTNFIGTVGAVNYYAAGLGPVALQTSPPYAETGLPSFDIMGYGTSPANATIASNTTWQQTYNKVSTTNHIVIRFYDED